MKKWWIGLAAAAGVGAATVAADLLATGSVGVKGAALAIILAAGALKGVISYIGSQPPPVEEPTK